MAQGRLNRDQFFEKPAEMEATDLKKALWTVYWRGAAPLRERVEAIIDPQSTEVRDRGVKAPPDPGLVLGEVTQFAGLARSGSYLAGDRRVSRQERSQWRHTFRRLSGEAQDALRGEDVETAGVAVTGMGSRPFIPLPQSWVPQRPPGLDSRGGATNGTRFPGASFSTGHAHRA